MVIALVHGLPETADVWEPLRQRLPGPSVALRLPGFGAPALPSGGSKDALAGWLAEELGRLGPDTDVVAHDLGALLTLRVVTARTAAVRSWAVDVADLFHPEAVWSDRVRTLQLPGEGEALLAAERARPDGAAARLRASGVPVPLSSRIAAAHDERMDEAVLAFYRSAIPRVASDWWPLEDGAEGRGLVLELPDPPEVRRRVREVAARLGAATADLGDLGHCWMAQDPDRVAGVLTRFWAAV